MPERAGSAGGSSKRNLRLTYYDILGVPVGASIDHIRDSYRLLSRKTLMTDVAYRMLTDPLKRREYSVWLLEESKVEAHTQVEQSQEGQDRGSRGRERCFCGKSLEIDDELYCRECWGRLDYYVVFDMFGGHIMHDSQVSPATEAYGQTDSHVACASVFGPFSKEEAEAVLKEKNKIRGKA